MQHSTQHDRFPLNEAALVVGLQINSPAEFSFKLYKQSSLSNAIIRSTTTASVLPSSYSPTVSSQCVKEVKIRLL